MEYIDQIAAEAKKASRVLGRLDTQTKNAVLKEAAASLRANAAEIIAANARDMERAKENNMPLGLQDRLFLDESRIDAMACQLEEVADLNDPIGEVLEMKKRPNGLMIGRKRVPLGVVAVIYEARPNVTSDVFGLCFKTGNAALLKGGKDAYYSCLAIGKALQQALEKYNLPKGALQVLEDTSREASNALMKCNRYVDVLIPRGGAGLIASVVQNATVPVIETGTGNCHVYVDESADPGMAVDIIINGKTQRVGVCNAVESILIHRSMIDSVMPALAQRLAEHHVEMRADPDLIDRKSVV